MILIALLEKFSYQNFITGIGIYGIPIVDNLSLAVLAKLFNN